MADTPESPQHSVWRKEFERAPEMTIRLLAVPDPNRVSPDPKSVFAKAWLDERAADKRDAREEATLSMAKEALATAQEANRIASEDLKEARSSASSALAQARWAKCAAIIAAVVAVVSAINQILTFISSL